MAGEFPIGGRMRFAEAKRQLQAHPAHDADGWRHFCQVALPAFLDFKKRLLVAINVQMIAPGWYACSYYLDDANWDVWLDDVNPIDWIKGQ